MKILTIIKDKTKKNTGLRQKVAIKIAMGYRIPNKTSLKIFQ
jgi:hypothetical protein